MGALRTPTGSSESALYENIVSIPHYTAKYMHSLVDKENESEVVNDNITRFQQMYQPIWHSQFKDCFTIADGKFEINHDDATRKLLMSHVNDNVYQNINSKTISLRSYDQDKKFHKSELDAEKKSEIIEEVIQESLAEAKKEVKSGDAAEIQAKAVELQNKEFATSIDKILIAHRNTKFFLFVMSW